MVVGEACNFVAYAFTQAILVTPLGALSVVLRYGNISHWIIKKSGRKKKKKKKMAMMTKLSSNFITI